MFLSCRISFIVLVILATTAAQAATPLRICAEPDNLPMSQQSSNSGFELEAAQLLAKDMGQTLEVKWIAQRDHSYFRQTIGAGVCDAIMSVPADFHRLTVTQPWYRTGFVFVTRKAGNYAPKSFDDAQLSKLKIGVPATGLGDTPPAIALTKRGLAKNLQPYSITEPQALITAVAHKDVDMGIVWGPFAGWYADKQNTPLTVTAAPDQDGPVPFAFDIAIGVKKGNKALKDKLNAALVHQQAALQLILQKWHIPLRAGG